MKSDHSGGKMVSWHEALQQMCPDFFFLQSWEQPMILDGNKGWLLCFSQAAAFTVLFLKGKNRRDIYHPEYGNEAKLILKYASTRINWR